MQVTSVKTARSHVHGGVISIMKAELELDHDSGDFDADYE